MTALSMTDRVRVPEPEVAARVIEGEAIIINLASGMYYSLDEVGGAVWSLLERGHSLEEGAAAIAARYGIGEERARADIRRLVGELHDEGLVVRLEHPSSAPALEPDGQVMKGSYEPPRLNKYDDMAELFAQDPPLPELPDV